MFGRGKGGGEIKGANIGMVKVGRVDEDVGEVVCNVVMREVDIVNEVASVLRFVAKGGKVGANSARLVRSARFCVKGRG